jgi:hypothetical protein
MVFLVIVLSSTVGYFTYGVNLIEELNDQVFMKTIEMQDKSRENFEITSARIDDGQFNFTIHNTGEIPINFTRVWVNNVTDSTWPLQNFTLNKIATPQETITNVGQGISLQALESQAYSIKLITQRGLGKEFSINSPSQEPLDLQLIALPETVSDGFRTTLLLTVTNNMTKSNMLLNVKPIMATPQVTGTASYTLISDATPNEKLTLDKGDSAYFTWIYEISGTLDDTVVFTVNLQNGFPQNSASSTVRINDVLLAQQSLTPPLSKDLLIFHGETSNTPSGEYQMYPGDPDIAGITISVETDDPKFFTNNGTAVNVSPGNWNASLVYHSAPYPDSLMDNNSANMKLHFEENINPQDSTGNTNGHNLGSGSERPTFEPSGGPHNSGAFRFDDNDYIELDNESENDIRSSPDSTSLWFKGDDGINDKQVLYRVNSNDNDDYYEIGLYSDDDVYFTFRTNSGATPALCESSGDDYANGKWQHLVAVRTGAYDCLLYINGTSVDPSPQQGGPPGTQINSDENFVGAEDSNPGDGFNGVIDDLLHWDSYALSQSEITDLFNTNYGDAAHLITFTIDKTDQLGGVQNNILTDNSYPLKFLDSKANNAFLDSFNYSSTTSIWSNFTESERLLLGIEFVSGLDLDLRIDDTSITGDPDNSFLQPPQSTAIFQSFITVISNQPKTLSVYNAGPTTAWITFEGTRLTFEDINSSNTYASIILNANSTDVDATQDSIAFPIGSVIDLTFSTPKNPPATTGSTGLIDPGSYNMKMHITGYDIEGKSITRTIDYGTVSVT